MQSWVSKKLTGLNSIGPINPYPLTLDQYTNCHWSKWSMVNQFQIPKISLVNRVHVTQYSYGKTHLQSLGFYKNNMIACTYIIQVSNNLEWIYIFGESPILVWPIPSEFAVEKILFVSHPRYKALPVHCEHKGVRQWNLAEGGGFKWMGSEGVCSKWPGIFFQIAII